MGVLLIACIFFAVRARKQQRRHGTGFSSSSKVFDTQFVNPRFLAAEQQGDNAPSSDPSLYAVASVNSDSKTAYLDVTAPATNDPVYEDPETAVEAGDLPTANNSIRYSSTPTSTGAKYEEPSRYDTLDRGASLSESSYDILEGGGTPPLDDATMVNPTYGMPATFGLEGNGGGGGGVDGVEEEEEEEEELGAEYEA